MTSTHAVGAKLIAQHVELSNMISNPSTWLCSVERCSILGETEAKVRPSSNNASLLSCLRCVVLARSVAALARKRVVQSFTWLLDCYARKVSRTLNSAHAAESSMVSFAMQVF